MNINELSNAEVLFLYFSNQNYIDGINDILEYGSTYQELDLAGISRITIEKPLSPEELEDLRNSVFYLNALSVNDKLEPIVQMIKEADSALYNSFVNTKEKLS
jgi:hypothetical protein